MSIKKWVSFLSVLLFMLLSGCARQPDAEHLQRDLQQALDESFGAGQFAIISLQRKGSASDQNAPSGDNRRVIYYTVELKTLKPLTLGDWEQPGAAGLVNILGAGPRSITGVKLQGNEAGSIIKAQASALYKEHNDQWVRVSSSDFQVAKAPVVDSGAFPSMTQQQMKRLKDLVEGLPRSELSIEQQLVQHDLRFTVAMMQGRLDQQKGLIPIASGLEQGEYFALSQALSLASQGTPAPFSTLQTAGSVDNLNLLRMGNAQVALAQADIARLAYKGEGMFSVSGSFSGLRTLGSLYPEFVHIVGSSKAGVESIKDIKGKTVAIGLRGSAVRITVEKILDAYGLLEGRDYKALEVSLETGFKMMEQGKVAVVAHVIGVPASPFRTLLLNPDYHLLSLDSKVLSEHKTLTLPAGTYPLQKQDIETVAIPVLLLVRADLPEDKARAIAHQVFAANTDLLAKGSAQGAQINQKMAHWGVDIPFHETVKH